MPSPKLNASAPKKWRWQSPGCRCAGYLKWWCSRFASECDILFSPVRMVWTRSSGRRAQGPLCRGRPQNRRPRSIPAPVRKSAILNARGIGNFFPPICGRKIHCPAPSRRGEVPIGINEVSAGNFGLISAVQRKGRHFERFTVRPQNRAPPFVKPFRLDADLSARDVRLPSPH